MSAGYICGSVLKVKETVIRHGEKVIVNYTLMQSVIILLLL